MTLAVIFDMDGTLFQTNKILELSLEDTFNYLRKQNKWDTVTPINTYREIMGAPLPIVWETLLPNHSLDVRKETDTYFLHSLIENIQYGKGALYSNAKETFEFLKENDYEIYIASNGLIKYLKAIVNYYHLDDWVTETFSIEQINTLNKSDLVQFIIKNYKITNGAVVGDQLSDILAAKNNGLLSIGCNFDFAREDELDQADFVIDDLLQITSILGDY